uniref:Small ribosomal subunit protein uS17c n=1 Tax=Synarthrophyton chejuense TaxID=2485825 RepID=A0A3G3MFX3_9FLOR|nr:ribosomal protein S17 [Synarthrophyton chejuense]AYR05725.1 ribosomal protein S17 [Synarthrophyton chejuense]
MGIKEIIGKVINNKMDKTITVAVIRKISHNKYNKVLSKTKKYYAHDENNSYSKGDIVKIKEVRPISKTKCWKVIEKINN